MTYTSILQISDRLFQCPRSWRFGVLDESYLAILASKL